jgi:hypothetical protein
MSVLLLYGYCVLVNGCVVRSRAREKLIYLVGVYGILMDCILAHIWAREMEVLAKGFHCCG